MRPSSIPDGAAAIARRAIGRSLARGRPLAWWWSKFWLLITLVLVSGCISLPAPELRPTSHALPAGQDTPLGIAAAAGRPASGASGFRLLPSGPAALTARLELIQRAESSLDLQYFLLRADRSGLELLRSLRDAATRGVRVRLLLDDLYAPGDELLLSLAAYPNVEVRLFNPLPLRNPGLIARFAASLVFFERLNHRMHNKLFVADGVLGITGGRNVADEYFSRRLSANFVDLDVLTAGAIVAEMSASFDTYCNSSLAYPVLEVAAKPPLSTEGLQQRFDSLVGQAVAPERAMPSEADVFGRPSLEVDLQHGRLELLWGDGRSFADAPDKGVRTAHGGAYGEGRVQLGALELIRAARSEVILTSPYFVPGAEGVELVRSLTQRGVAVRILTNSLASTDQPLVHGAYRRYRGPLLQAGADLYEISPKWIGSDEQRKTYGLSPGGLHAKSLVIDRETVVVGSMNFDPRSDHFNTESAIVVRIPEVAREVAQLARLGSLEGAHRLRLADDGARLLWDEPLEDGGGPHTNEPEASLWRRFWLRVLSVFAPESLL